MDELARLSRQIERDGYALLSAVFPQSVMAGFSQRIDALFQDLADDPAILRSSGHAYGMRDLLRLLPEVEDLARHDRITALLGHLLGPQAGLVRGLFFDKPPTKSWSLPWHQDRTIAVRDNSLASEQFRNPTRKAGITHVEAPDKLLRSMLTLRIHLDAMIEENGPLAVLPGSHGTDSPPDMRPTTAKPTTIPAQPGDVLAMRPLLSHCSGSSQEGSSLHRRVIHLEFAPRAELPDQFCRHTFLPVE